MSETKGKKRHRIGHRTHIRKVLSNSQELFGAELSDEIIGKLKANLIALQTKREVLEKLNTEILETLEEDKEVETEIVESSDFTDKINECIAHIEHVLKKHSEPKASELNTNHSTTKSICSAAKLPKLELCKFSGNPLDWQPFYDSFKSVVDENPQLSKVDKFNYLKACLLGTAADCIRGFSLTDSNYTEALKLLQERYGSKQVIISSHMDSLLKLPIASSMSDVTKLREIYDKVETHVRSLHSLGLGSENYGSLLSPVILQKLPEELRIVIGRKQPEEWDLDSLLKTFQSELQIREKCAFVGGSSNVQNNMYLASNKGQVNSRKSVPTVSTLYTEEKEQRGPWCAFCNGNHPSTKCSIVTNVKERKGILRKKGRCFICLNGNHIASACERKGRCYRCKGAHHISICEKTQSLDTQGQSNTNNNSVSSKPTTNMYIDAKNSVLLQTARANVSNPEWDGNIINTRVVFDSCSQRSYITQELRNKLNLKKVGSETLMIKTFGEGTSKICSCDVVQVCAHTIDGMNVYFNAFVVPVICSPVHGQLIDLAKQSYSHLHGLNLADYSDGTSDLPVDILIGADYYWNFVDGYIVKGLPNEPVAISTKLGFVLSGAMGVTVSTNHSTINLTETHVLKIQASAVNNDSGLISDIHKFWDYETLGIRDNETPVYEQFLNNIEFNGERYSVNLPFKSDHLDLPDNYDISFKRLKSRLNKLKASPEILQSYDKIIREQATKGIIEPITLESGVEAGKVHYMPHHEVLRPDKDTTKVRIVYDGSAKREGPSLNECLYPGPSLLPHLFDVLLRFRIGRIGLVGDIEQAFLNVEIAPEERDYLRFLWIDNLNNENPKVLVYRFCRVVFGLTCSPFLLNGTLRHHLTEYFKSTPETASKILQSLYVDDFESTVDNDEEGHELYSELKHSLKVGGFNMRKWKSNSKTLIQMLINSGEEDLDTPTVAHSEVDDQTYTQSQFDSTSVKNTSATKVLGLLWDTVTDTLSVDFSNLLKNLDGVSVITKRLILSTSARLYDPLGLAGPITLMIKVLFQKACKDKIDWDCPVKVELSKPFLNIVKEMRVVQRISVDRHYFNSTMRCDIINYELHGFSDASNSAYGACVYLRAETKSGEVITALIASKSRLTPLGGETIPRLELLGALVLSRLMSQIERALQDNLEINGKYCWLDSQVALCWIAGINKQFKQFVQNRVVEIRRLVPVSAWRYCSTLVNPADIISRGALPTKLVNCQLWFEGPPFLKDTHQGWASGAKLDQGIDDPQTLLELRRSEEKQSSTLLVNVNEQSFQNLENILPSTSYSSLDKLLRITAYIFRFTKNLSRKVKGENLVYGELTVEELEHAHCCWVKEAQQEFETRDDKKFRQLETSLGVYRCEKTQILLCKGRLGNAPLPEETRYPILLPSNHHITKLLIMKCHLKVQHNGLKETLNELRTKYWVIRGRQTVKKFISKCSVCKRIEGKSYSTPVHPPLPEYRVSEEMAFVSIGVDFAGPLFVKGIYSQTTEEMNKAYIALFTCASSRALHLELVPDLCGDSFIRALKRFIGRRGFPRLVISDNGKTFKDKKLMKFCLLNGIKWSYIIERAPWWGGFYERLVRSVKSCLKKNFRNARLTFEELSTVLIEIEGVLNSRPLTYLYNSELEQPLTPSHLVIGRRILSQPHSHPDDDSINDGNQLPRRAAYLNSLLNHFKSRFKKEYLTELREYQNCGKNNNERTIKVGDLVTVHDDKPRQTWKLGKIEHLITGTDGKVRSARVRVTQKDSNTVVLNRPLQRLYPLEVRLEDHELVVAGGTVPTITFVHDKDVSESINNIV